MGGSHCTHVEADISAELPEMSDEVHVGTGLSLHPTETQVNSAWSRAGRVKERDREKG